MRRRLSLSTLTASTIAAMLLLSIAITYFGISWYSDRIEAELLDKLPPRLSQAYRDISTGKTPDRDDLMQFVAQLPAFNDAGNAQLYASIIDSACWRRSFAR